MTMTKYSLEDITKAYDNFFRDYFKDHARVDEIKLEYTEFKKELLTLASQMNEEDFANYAAQKKVSIKAKIQELTVKGNTQASQPLVAREQSNGRLVTHDREKSIYFFDFLRNSTASKSALDSFLKDLKIFQVADLVAPGVISNLISFGKSKDRLIAKELKKMTDLERDFSNQILSTMSAALRRDTRSIVRVFDFQFHDRTPTGQILMSLVSAALEKNIISNKSITDYLTSLYTISYHYSLRTDYYLVLSDLCRYIQNILIEIESRKADGDSSAYQNSLLNLFFQTMHDEKVFKGFKTLVLLLAKTVLDLCDASTISATLGLRPEDTIALVRHTISDFIQNYLQKDLVSYDNFELHRAKFLKVVSIIGHCLNSSFECNVIFSDGTISNVCTPFRNAQENQYMIIVPSERKTLFAYNEVNKQLIDALKSAEPVFGLEDFCSVSDQEDAFTPKGTHCIKEMV